MSSKKIENRMLKGVPFILNVETEAGEEQLSFRLVFDFNALALVEEKTGYSLLSGTIFNHLDVRVSTVLFWAAVQQRQPEYAGDEGLKVVGTLLSLKNINDAQLAVQEAFLQALPEEQAAKIRAVRDAKVAASPKEVPPSNEA